MNDIKEYAVSLCFCAVFCTLISFMIPPGNHKKLMSIIINSFFVMMLVTPIVKGFNIEIPKVTFDTRVYENRMNDEIKSLLDSQIGESVEKGIALRLENMGAPAKKISVLMDTSDTSRIQISKLMIVLDRKYLLQEIKISDAMISECGIQPQLTFE